jgi:hypothetical protein
VQAAWKVNLRKGAVVVACFAAIGMLAPAPASAQNYHQMLAMVDQALESNPSQVPAQSIKSCQTSRNMAVKLYKMGKPARAERRLKHCMQLLKIGKFRYG